MKLSTLSLSIVSLLAAFSVNAGQTFFASNANGSIRHMDATANGDTTVIVNLEKANHKNKMRLHTLQLINHNVSFEETLAQIDQFEGSELAASVRATGGREFAENFPMPFTLANETYSRAQPATVGNAAIFHERIMDSRGHTYAVPALYVNINGQFVPAKERYFQAPDFVKSAGRHLFNVVITDITDNVLVGFIEAKQAIEFSSDSKFIAKGEKFPVYWTLKPEMQSSCNVNCQQQLEAHMSVSSGQLLGIGKRMSNIKATASYTDELGESSRYEIVNWFEFNPEGNALQSLQGKPYGISKDPVIDNRYWIYGSAAAKGNGDHYYQTKPNQSPAAAIALDL